MLYDLTVFLWFVYHSTIEPTQDDLVPVRIAKKMLPFLHLLPREDSEGKDWRVYMLDFLAWYFGLEKKSSLEGVKTHYLPGDRLGQWGHLTLATQTRLALIWWLQMDSWVDPIPSACREREIIQKHKEARGLLTAALLRLETERWYATSQLLNALWERHPTALRSGRTLSREQWMRAEGVYYTALLASSLHELGVVSLGYHQDSDRDLETRLNPDLFLLTEVGKAALTSTLSGFPSGETPTRDGEPRPLIVQPNFEVLFLTPDHLQALYQVLPFVEVQQIDRVSRGRLTQDALHDGLGQGWAIEQIIPILSELSQKEIPQNVLYSLREWASKHKSAHLSQVVLIEVANEGVADAVCGMETLRQLGVRKIAPCCLAVLDPAKLLAVRQALLKEGVAVRIMTAQG